MFVSIHLPKCAGKSLQFSLKGAFGQKLYLDYGDKILDQRPATKKLRADRTQRVWAAIAAKRFDFEIVHGHFYASKYVGKLKGAKWMTVVRDPFNLLPSYYDYLRRAEHSSLLTQTARDCESLLDFICNPLFHNIQTKLISPLTASDFHFIGLQEHFDLTTKCLSVIYERDLQSHSENVNPATTHYTLSEEEKAAIIRLNAKDLEFYSSARNTFFAKVRSLL